LSESKHGRHILHPIKRSSIADLQFSILNLQSRESLSIMPREPFRSFAIVPAAGRSRRMGRPKLLLPWGGGTVIDAVLAAWRASRVTQTVVVVHPEDEPLAQVCRSSGADVVVADPPPEDMKASIGRGLRHVAARFQPAPRDVWLVAPADLPLLSAVVIDAVLAAHDPSRPAIVAPQSAGRRGHPVLFPWPLSTEVDLLPADVGIKELLSRHPVKSVECPAVALAADIDTPEDYRRLRGE
jgi:molybdenum cofactor cytidylyltransferase